MKHEPITLQEVTSDYISDLVFSIVMLFYCQEMIPFGYVRVDFKDPVSKGERYKGRRDL